jgi:hypothetical protein
MYRKNDLANKVERERDYVCENPLPLMNPVEDL